MAETNGRTANRKKTRLATRSATGSGPIESGEAAELWNAIRELGSDFQKALVEELRKTNGDPSKAHYAFCKFVSFALANDMGGLAISIVAAAKDGDASALKVLVDLSRIASEARGDDGKRGDGIRLSDLLNPDFDLDSLLHAQEPLGGNTAEAGIDVGFGGREPE